MIENTQTNMFVDTGSNTTPNHFHEEKIVKYLENAKKFDIFFLIIAVSIVIFYKMTHKYKTDISELEEEQDENEKEYKKALVHGEFHQYPLLSKNELTKETAIYRFGLPSDSYVLGLPIGQHISIKAEIDGKKLLRSYTPISLDYEAPGYFDLLVKAYPTGNISKMIGELKIGDKIDVCGPAGFYDYNENCRKKLGMVAGGTGITPMYQIMKAIADNPKDTTEISLIYGNTSESEIFLKKELDELCERRPGQINVYYLIDKPEHPDEWKGGIGYVTADLLKEKIASPEEDGVQLLLCGPPRMVSSVKRMAVAMGYTKGKPVSKMEDQIFAF
ncbi:NADH-cytochrome b5 reductase [Maudiozyma exigua]|uniref:NADH-cytochrome b5 reductase n=1 Tax=Maudiozyma exigua TaxID=34358 RepID=A0A9P6VYD7_MAUEX|nr:NADH-cytochrome b5 reductase [Kazachstania exigua]